MPVGDSPFDEGTGDSAPIIPRAQPVQQSSVLDNIAAGYTASRAGPGSTLSHENGYAKPYYDRITAELNRRGYRSAETIPNDRGGTTDVPREFTNPLGWRIDPRWNADPLGNAAREQQRIWEAVRAERAKDPTFLRDIPDHAALEQRIVADRQRDYATANEVMDRAGFAGKAAAFIGQVAGGWADPENYVGGISGGAAKTVAGTVVKHALAEGATNAAGAALALPGMTADANRMGIDMTAGDMVEQVATSAAFGAIVGGGKIVVPRVLAPVGKAAAQIVDHSLSHLPEPVRTAAVAASLRAGTIDDRALVAEGRRVLSPSAAHSIATPDENAALHVIDRDADTREASPFHPSDDPAHENRLGAVMDSLGLKPTAPDVPSPAPLPASHPARFEPGQAPPAYADAIGRAEGYSATPKAGSSIEGYGQFSRGTWLQTYKQHFGGAGMTDDQILALRHDKATGLRMIAAYGEDNGRYLRAHGQEDSNGNKSLAHFLGAGDALKVLQAAPDAPIESIINAASYRGNEKLLRGKSASEVIAWAHKRVGDAVGEPVARGDAVAEPEIYEPPAGVTLPPVTHETFAPHELTTDAAAMQYKSGGDANGVTDRLAGVDAWNPIFSGKMVVWERLDGELVVADGHQRLGLAKRVAERDPEQNVRLDAIRVREADGVTAQMARVMAALKNIEEGSGDVLDAARVLRDAPDGARMLSRNAPRRATAEGIANLSSEAFGAALNNVLPTRIAAQIGIFGASQPENHMALMQLLKATGINAPDLAASVVKQAMADGFGAGSSQQLSMFGDEAPQALYSAVARVYARARQQIKDERRSFKTLTNDATRIEQAGNSLDRNANQAKVIANDHALAILDATAHRSGPVRDALLAAAREHIAGDRSGAVKQFLRDLDGIDLQAAAAGVGADAGARLDAGGSGFAFDAGEAHPELADGRELPGGPTAYDEAIAAGQASLGFSEPVGPAAEAQTARVEHDLKAELGGPRAGAFGPVFTDVDPTDWQAVVAKLTQAQDGEIHGALQHDGVGPIDLVWGNPGTGRHDGYGLSKILQFHPEVVENLPAIVRSMAVATRRKNRIKLESADHEAGIRLDWDGQQKTWLITAYEKEKASPATEGARAAGDAQAGNFPAHEAGEDISPLPRAVNPLEDQPHFRIDEEGPERTYPDILAEADADIAAIEALKGCL